jgi:hypothetical protein
VKRIAYHRLAAAELIKSARFYDRRRPKLGDQFLSAVEAVQELIRNQPEDGKCLSLRGPQGYLLRDGPFRIVFRLGKDNAHDVVFAIAPAGIDPTENVWRYFDQPKAEDLLKTGCLYFCRLDQLTDDPREARLPLYARRVRTHVYGKTFGADASKVVNESEEILRGTTYVCCWTRREHESYLAWRH